MAPRKNASTRYAIVGLVLAVIGCLATAGVGILRGTVAMGLYTPARPETLTRALAISVGVLIVGIAVYGILNPSGVRRFMAGRQARYGSNALIMSLAFIGILLVVNWLVYQNPQKWDWSEGKKHTLAPESLQALDALPGNVLAKAFYSTQYPTATAKTLLENFKTSSNGKFEYEFIDPNADPVQAQQYGITGDGKIVLVMGDTKEIASYADENTITQAMIRLISPQARTVYFLSGHGEPDLKASDASSMLRARQSLESKNYTVEELRLAATNKVPEDAKAVIIAGATHPLLEQEVALLKSYVDGGGALVVLAATVPYAVTEKVKDPFRSYLADDWSITLHDTVVIDPTSTQPFYAISASWSATAPITSRITSFMIMPESRSIALGETAPENVTTTALILTSEQSWGETDFVSLATQGVPHEDAADIPGPLTLAASAENAETSARVVVFANTIFATNEAFDAYANGEVFINAVDWAAQEEDLINITPRETVERTFNPPGQFQFILILLTAVFVLPGLVLIAGISNWLARRKRG